jgi:hypothetical protein
MVKFAKEMGADHLGVTHVVPQTKEMKKESLHKHRKETNSMIGKAKRLAQSLELSTGLPELFDTSDRVSRIFRFFSRSKNTKRSRNGSAPCFFLWERVYLDTWARIMTCCHPSHPVNGSLKDQDFSAIWNGDEYRAMRKTFSGGPAHPLCGPCSSGGYLTNL